ncbi:hypothetical protein BLA60_08085 [Actinophytocola xinjiangensis]|uniref:Acyl transferase domain-containing protein n=1 Tax=Actinophytocola xinjiangensis TaxID=485602 RepID=A0A7Z0WQ15_9PSEU|nr:hypothetical protein BLA60_08085 [Actinophytocola xinjiangensis]
MSNEPIAVIGIGCRFPGARDAGELWNLLLDGGERIREVPPERFDINLFHDATPQTPGKIVTRCGGFLDGIDQFDAAYFRVSPREAAQLDPQHRLLLETTADALRDAGLTREALGRTGAFVGQISRTYWELLSTRGILDVYSSLGTMGSGASGRLTHAFDLRGPSVSVDTACSSSLVAVHTACRSLRAGECDVAIAGGVSLILGPADSIAYSQANMLAPDGRCKFGSASANGFVRSDGIAAVVLKPLSRAAADGDRVHALILGTSALNDGTGASMMTPSQAGQAAALRAAYADAGIDPAEVGYVEAHGTGTPVGDPVELAAIAEVIGAGRDRPLAVGSVKTNIGHAEAAAGMAGLIKAILCVRHRHIPVSLHAEDLNPAFDWDALPVEVARTARPWPTDGRAVAGVSSTGLSGTNVHVVVAEAPPPRPRATAPDQARLLTLSARDRRALRDLAESTASLLDSGAAPDICHTAGARRDHHEHRLTAVGATADELAERLRAYLAGSPARGLAAATAPGSPPRVVFVFPGQGSQWVGMARELIRTAPAFAATLAECDAAVRAEAGWSPIERLASDAELSSVDVVQPVLWAVEVALAAQWSAWGVRPDAVVGHSMGEVAAACVAGALSLADGAAVICRRSALLTRVSGRGAMASVELTVEQAEAEIGAYADRVSVAVSNSAGSTVLSGDPGALDEIIAGLAGREVFARRVKVDVASHSPRMDELRADLLAALESVRPRAGTVPLMSTVDQREVSGDALTAGYWVRNLREPVMFGAVTRELAGRAPTVFVEMSPHPVLVPALEETVEDAGQGTVVGSLRRDEPELETLLHAVGQAHLAGVRLDWALINPGRHTDLPAYPWQRSRHWFADTPTAHPLLTGLTRSRTGGWTGRLDLTANAYLRDHRVQETAVLPGSAYAELLHAALGGDRGTVELRDVVLHNAIYLDPAPTVLVEITGDQATVSSRPDDTRPWVTNATGTVVRHTPAAPATAAAYLRGVVRDHWSGPDFYGRFAGGGNEWRGAFQGIVRLWRGTDEATAHLAAPPAIVESLPSHTFHPALLDACFQVLVGVIEPADTADSLLLGGFDSLRVYREVPATGLRCRAVRVPGGRPGSVAGDLTVTDREGVVVAEISGLWSRDLTDTPTARPGEPLGQAGDSGGFAGANRADDLGRPEEAGQWVESNGLGGSGQGSDWTVESSRVAGELGRDGSVDELLHEVRWRSAPQLSPDTRLTRWVVFLDDGGIGWDLAARLGGDVVTVAGGDGFRDLGGGHYEIDPASAADYRAVLGVRDDRRCGVVHLWGLDTAGPVDASAVRTVPPLVAAFEEPVDLWLVTRGAQCLDGDPLVVPAQTMLWGLGRSLAAERADVRTVLVDLAAGTRTAAQLAREVGARDDGENQIALRATGRHVARLVRGVTAARHTGQGDPGPGQVAVDVAHVASGVCGGTVVALGAGVAGVTVGDTVVAVAQGPVADARLVFAAPGRLGLAEAVVSLGAHLVAYLGLRELRAGGRVLIHPASGPVGLAAVQYARHLDAEVYATDDDPDRRALLGMAGLRQVGGESTVTGDVLAQTRGRGVDVVLVTRPGEPVPAVLAPGGTGVTAPELAAFAHARPDETATALRRVLALLDAGLLGAIPGQTRGGDPAARFAIRPDGTYLVTGGLGGLGGYACRWLLDNGAGHVLAVGRSAATAPDPRITYARADVTDEDALRSLLAESGLPPVRGVIHAAGVLDFAAFDEYTPGHLDAMLAPKVAGGWAVHRATLGQPLDFFVLYSSGTSVFGSAHTSAYAAANAYLDGLAHHRRLAGLPATSVNWGYWSGAGMVVRLEAARGESVVPTGMSAFGPEEAMPALHTLLTRGAVQATVVAADWPRCAAEPDLARNPLLRDLLTAPTPVRRAAPPTWTAPSPAASESLPTAVATTRPVPPPAPPRRSAGSPRTIPKPAPPARPVAAPPASPRPVRAEEATPATAPARDLSVVLADAVASVMGMSTHDLDVTAPLNTMGFDSLMAGQVRSRVREATGLLVPITRMLSGRSVTELASGLHEQAGNGGAR